MKNLKDVVRNLPPLILASSLISGCMQEQKSQYEITNLYFNRIEGAIVDANGKIQLYSYYHFSNRSSNKQGEIKVYNLVPSRNSNPESISLTKEQCNKLNDLFFRLEISDKLLEAPDSFDIEKNNSSQTIINYLFLNL